MNINSTKGMTMKRFTQAFSASVLGATMLFGTAACSSQADTTSKNLSNDADNFKINRRVVFVNGITDKYLLSIEGLCSINTDDIKKLAVTCGNIVY